MPCIDAFSTAWRCTPVEWIPSLRSITLQIKQLMPRFCQLKAPTGDFFSFRVCVRFLSGFNMFEVVKRQDVYSLRLLEDTRVLFLFPRRLKHVLRQIDTTRVGGTIPPKGAGARAPLRGRVRVLSGGAPQ